MVWGSLGLNESDVIYAVGAGLATFLTTRQAFARETFGRAQLGRLLLTVIGIFAGFILLGSFLDQVFGVSRLPAILPRVVLSGFCTFVGFLAAKYIRPPRAMDEPPYARVEVHRRRES